MITETNEQMATIKLNKDKIKTLNIKNMQKNKKSNTRYLELPYSHIEMIVGRHYSFKMYVPLQCSTRSTMMSTTNYARI